MSLKVFSTGSSSPVMPTVILDTPKARGPVPGSRIPALKRTARTPPDQIRSAGARTSTTKPPPSAPSRSERECLLSDLIVVMESTLDEKFKSVESNISQCISKVQSLEKNVVALAKQLENSEDRFNIIAEGISKLQASHTGLAEKVHVNSTNNERFEAALRSQHVQIEALSAELHCCTREIQFLKESGTCTTAADRVPQRDSSPEHVLDSRLNEMEQHLSTLAREEGEKLGKINNVILNGVPEDKDEQLAVVVQNLVPGLEERDIISAARINPASKKSVEKGTSSDTDKRTATTQTQKPRLIRAVLTTQGKQLLMQKKKEANHRSTPVYVSHDLTRKEQQRRREVVPTFVALRKQSVACSLPHDVIIRNGKPMTDAEIVAILGKPRVEKEQNSHGNPETTSSQ